MLKPRIALVVTVLSVGGQAACTLTRPTPADVRVPPELLRSSGFTAGGEPPRTRYVVRMTDGQRDWEIQLPEIATAYEVKVPLGGKPGAGLGVDMATMTAADREILADRQAAERAAADSSADESGEGQGQGQGQGEGGEGQTPTRASLRSKAGQDDGDDDGGDGATRGAKGKRRSRASGPAAGSPAGGSTTDKPPSGRPSYLLTLAKVKDLYRTRHYELALVELVELEKQYPNDEHILSMKGSLQERLGNKTLAREAWQQVLTLNPFNLAVLEALQRLGK